MMYTTIFSDMLLNLIAYQWRSQDFEKGGPIHGERGSASLYGGLGALPPVGSRGKAPGQGVRGASPPLKLIEF